jgi:hypothetical protein
MSYLKPRKSIREDGLIQFAWDLFLGFWMEFFYRLQAW